MSPTLFILICLILTAILLFAEVILPTHGILGVLALVCYLVAIGACFYVNKWIGTSVLAVSALASPFVGAGMVRLWQKSPVGKKMILNPASSRVPPPVVPIGAEGISISELRPMGEVEFAHRRIEVASEFGMIAQGTRVKVVAFTNGRPVVRAEANR